MSAAPAWSDACLAATLLAIDPAGLGGVVLRAPAGEVRERWLGLLRQSAPGPWCKLPLHIGDGRLLGGLDLAATLKAGRPVAEQGLLAQADGGIVVAAMAERLEPSTVARLTSALDAGEVIVERDGLALRQRARFGVVALDEGIGDEERTNPALRDRLAFHADLAEVAPREAIAPPAERVMIKAARARLRRVGIPETIVVGLCEAALALGVASVRASILAVRAAKAAAAIAGRTSVGEEDAALAARLVLAPRMTQIPAQESPPPQEGEDDQPGDAAPEPSPDGEHDRESAGDAEQPLADLLLAAAQAAIPPDVLSRLLRDPGGGRAQNSSGGRAGAAMVTPRGGRPIGTRRGEPRGGARLSLVETLRAAAPWQTIRAREASSHPRPKVIVRADDFRIVRFQQRRETTTIFLVDASGSSALNRLAEAKGAVELLLADCYVRRDQVALIAFRGKGADLLLPPTRSLVRAKRSLAGLPGGGGTPLAAGLDAAALLADAVRRKGQSPTLVIMTDGRANTTRTGTPKRSEAETEAIAAAGGIRAAGIAAVLVDISPRPQAQGRQLADAMGARYLPLPYADAQRLSRAIRSA